MATVSETDYAATLTVSVPTASIDVDESDTAEDRVLLDDASAYLSDDNGLVITD